MASLRPGGRSRGLVVLAAAVAALPLVVAIAVALADGWRPLSDDSVIALRAFDVVSDRPPLVGQFSQTSPLIGEPAYSLGPLLYWLLAVPAHLGPGAIVLTIGAVNVACAVGAVLLAARRGGPGLAVAAAAVLVVAGRSLPAEVPYEVWNPWAGVFPFTLLLFVAWSVACGDYRLLPLMVLTASFVSQAHLTYLVPALMAVAVAAGGLVLWRRQRPSDSVRRWVIAAVAVAIVCWSAPVVDQLTREPGNLGQVVKFATDEHPTAGVATGWQATARTIGIPPWWALRVRNHAERLFETLDVPLLLSLSAVLVVCGLIAALAAAVRRRRHDVATGCTLALALCLAVTVVTAGIPAGNVGFVVIAYVLVWTSPAGMWIWLVLAWSTWELLRPTRLATALRRPAPVWAGLGAAAAVAVAVAASRDYEAPGGLPPGTKDYALIDATVERASEAVAGSKGVFIDVPSPKGAPNSATMVSAIAYALRRDGLSFSVPSRVARELGSQYLPNLRYEHVLRIRDGDSPRELKGRVVLRNSYVTVTVSRHP
jgi:hypothetical protein